MAFHTKDCVIIFSTAAPLLWMGGRIHGRGGLEYSHIYIIVIVLFGSFWVDLIFSDLVSYLGSVLSVFLDSKIEI